MARGSGSEKWAGATGETGRGKAYRNAKERKATKTAANSKAMGVPF